MAIDPTLACYLAMRAFAYDRRTRLARGLKQVHENRDVLADPRAKRHPTYTTAVEANDEASEKVDSQFRLYDWTCAVIDDCRILAFPQITIEDFDAAWGATEHMPGVPDIFERLPFSVCFFGFGDGILMDYLEESDADGTGPVLASGFMATREGDVFVVSSRSTVRHDTIAVPVCISGQWDPAGVGVGWVVHSILTAMEEVPPARVKVDLSTLTGRRAVERATKAGAPAGAPPPFYTVKIDGSRFHEIVRSLTSVPREYSHQWDVRQHTRTRFLRGTGEVPPETAALFVERGYEVHFVPGEEVRAELAARGLPPPGEGEWIATKRWKVREHVKGPEGRPYVPALRVSNVKPEGGR